MSAATKLSEAVSEERRTIDAKWKISVEDELKNGAEKFKGLAEGQTIILAAMKENTDATINIGTRLEQHIKSTDEKYKKLEPAVAAIETMQSGVRVMGSVGDFGLTVGKWARRVVVFVTPFVALVVGVVYFIKTGKWPSP
jgi:hypothetical protein